MNIWMASEQELLFKYYMVIWWQENRERRTN